MDAELALQKAVRDRLVTTEDVVSNVPAGHILDRNERPAPDPSIIIGTGQTVDDGNSIARDRHHIYMDLHIWKKEPSLTGVRAIAGALRSALHSSKLVLGSGYHCVDCRVASMRFLRDPDGETSHAVVSVEAIVVEVSQ
ncbi:DUF3168 domain-containing protein [Martelella limonii]|uniref:DUF3168 domain-containing protein n=1 Tax=Martelella limonii TaxID=1647649 RepID=UPI001580B8CF|nr:DUF3168 domain-containing protein [Martelella limonii]